jgi:ribosomal protein S18 acetylase RimI-like enzyme
MVTIKALKIEDIKTISTLHQIAFKNFFLTTLGYDFLIKFYTSILRSKDGIAIGAFDNNNKLVGFAIGANTKNGFYKSLLKNNFIPLLFSAFFNLLKQPLKIKRLLQSFLTSETLNEEFLNYATLLSICVDPDQKGQKIGKFLLKAFENEILNSSSGISLTTDKYNNDYVNNFYLSNNYILNNEFCQGNREMNYYIKKIK